MDSTHQEHTNIVYSDYKSHAEYAHNILHRAYPETYPRRFQGMFIGPAGG